MVAGTNSSMYEYSTSTASRWNEEEGEGGTRKMREEEQEHFDAGRILYCVHVRSVQVNVLCTRYEVPRT